MDKPDAIDYSIPGDVVLLFGPPDAQPAGTIDDQATPPPRPWRRVIVLTPHLRREWYDGEELNDYLSPEGATASIRFRGADYDVTQVAPRGSAVAYELRPADPSLFTKRLIEYSRSAELRRRASGRAFRRSLVIARFLWPLYPVLGGLPIEWQTSLGVRVPVDIQRMVNVNLATEAAFGIAMLFWQFVLMPLSAFIESAGQSATVSDSSETLTILGVVLLGDAFLRWRAVSRKLRLMGFLPFEMVWRLLAGKDE